MIEKVSVVIEIIHDIFHFSGFFHGEKSQLVDQTLLGHAQGKPRRPPCVEVGGAKRRREVIMALDLGPYIWESLLYLADFLQRP
jgi:hypothetical protein